MFWSSGATHSSQEIEAAVAKLEATRIEREIALKEAINERKNAYRIAEAQERFKWLALTGFATSVMSAAAAFYHKNVFYSLPIIPATTIIGYEAHKAYGNKIEIILRSADNVLKDSEKLLGGNTISVKEIDARVQDLLSSPETLD